MILVAGATGMMGGMITRQLLEQGQDVRVLVRPHSNYQPLVDAGAQPVFGGPETVSWRDVAAAYERVLGRPVEVQTLPVGQPIPWLPDVINGLLMGTETFDSEVDMSETSAAFGVRPTSLDELVQRHVSGAQGGGQGGF